jgi:hypothetical protein
LNQHQERLIAQWNSNGGIRLSLVINFEFSDHPSSFWSLFCGRSSNIFLLIAFLPNPVARESNPLRSQYKGEK